jgi:hypothetical protein
VVHLQGLHFGGEAGSLLPSTWGLLHHVEQGAAGTVRSAAGKSSSQLPLVQIHRRISRQDRADGAAFGFPYQGA